MSSTESKLWLFLNDTLPAAEGPSLIGTVVVDVQYPTNRYEPKFPSQPQHHPFLKSQDFLEPYIEDRTIAAGTSKGHTFEAGLSSFISNNIGSTTTRQAKLISSCITTYSLRSPSEVFKRLRNNPNHWKRVEELMRTNSTKKLYFVRGYKTAVDPVVSLHTSEQRSQGAEFTFPVITAATGGLTLPAGMVIGDPRLGASVDKGQTATQSGLVKGERLFAIQYWALVRKREAAPKTQGKRLNWSSWRRADDVQAKPPPGRNIMFHGHADAAEESDEDEDEDEEYDDDSEDENQDGWIIVECNNDALC